MSCLDARCSVVSANRSNDSVAVRTSRTALYGPLLRSSGALAPKGCSDHLEAEQRESSRPRGVDAVPGTAATA
jgi:hypothetical protein